MARKRRWDRSKYPDNWDELSWAFRSSKNFTCEHCGTEQGTLRISKAWNLYPARVVAAHRYPNDTANPDPELLCLCERCHFPYDARFRSLLEEGAHQETLHALLVDRYMQQEESGLGGEGWPELSGQEGMVCCSCGQVDETLQHVCGNCGRPVHDQEPECGGWFSFFLPDTGEEDHEFWCCDCWVNGLP